MAHRRGLDSGLVERAQAGDDDARRTLFDRIEPMLRAFFISRIGRRPDVDDLIQNTFVRLHRGLEDLQDTRRLKAFTMKAAMFELQDYYRGRYGPKERLFAPGFVPGDHVEPGPSGAGFDVERALSVLSPKARRIIELREYGYRYEEIARVVGTTEAAIKMQVKRAFEKMRRALVGVLAVVLMHGW